MTVRLRKVADGLPADEVVVQAAIRDKRHRLLGNTFVVDVVSAEKIFAFPSFEAGIVDGAHELGQDAGVKT